jgi:hypothetical protein
MVRVRFSVVFRLRIRLLVIIRLRPRASFSDLLGLVIFSVKICQGLKSALQSELRLGHC